MAELIRMRGGTCSLVTDHGRYPGTVGFSDRRIPNRELRAAGSHSPVLIVSAYGARAAQQELGAQGSISKPFDPEVLLKMLERILESQNA